MRRDTAAVFDHALWDQQSVDNVDDAVGCTVVPGNEWNAVDEELAGLGRDPEDFAIEWGQRSAVLEGSAELKARYNVVGNHAFKQLVV